MSNQDFKNRHMPGWVYVGCVASRFVQVIHIKCVVRSGLNRCYLEMVSGPNLEVECESEAMLDRIYYAQGGTE